MKNLPVKPISFLIFLALLLVWLAACQSQTLEVTRVVTETIIEQVESEAIEVEVTREVSVLAESEVESQTDPVEAAGSEEGGGSPFVPDKRFKVAPTRVASAGWVDTQTILNDSGMMRLIENSAQEIIVIHQLSGTAGRSVLLATPDRLYFSQWATSGMQSVPVHQKTPNSLRQILTSVTSTDTLVERSVLLSCELCGRGGSEETVVILWPASGLTLSMDQGETVAEAEPLLSAVRKMHTAQQQAASARAFRLNE